MDLGVLLSRRQWSGGLTGVMETGQKRKPTEEAQDAGWEGLFAFHRAREVRDQAMDDARRALENFHDRTRALTAPPVNGEAGVEEEAVVEQPVGSVVTAGDVFDAATLLQGISSLLSSGFADHYRRLMEGNVPLRDQQAAETDAKHIEALQEEVWNKNNLIDDKNNLIDKLRQINGGYQHTNAGLQHEIARLRRELEQAHGRVVVVEDDDEVGGVCSLSLRRSVAPSPYRFTSKCWFAGNPGGRRWRGRGGAPGRHDSCGY